MTDQQITRVEDLQPGDIATFAWRGAEYTGPVIEFHGSRCWGGWRILDNDYLTLVRAHRPEKRLRVALEGVVRTTKNGDKAGTSYLVLDDGATINLTDSHVLRMQEA